MKIAKHLLRPKVQAAFTREAMRQFDDRNALRPEEKSERQQPEPDGDKPARRHHRYQVHVGDGHHAQPRKIPASQDAPQVRSAILHPGLSSIRAPDPRPPLLPPPPSPRPPFTTP